MGVVEGEWWLVDQAKMTRVMKRAVLPNPADFVIGRIVRMRIDAVIKPDGGVKPRTTINIFVSGASPREGTPSFVQGQRYLVFLSPLKELARNLRGTAVYKPKFPSAKEVPFDAKSSYVVVGNDYGVIQFTPTNLRAIEEIKAAVRASRG
jgi:hypothetical protein